MQFRALLRRVLKESLSFSPSFSRVAASASAYFLNRFNGLPARLQKPLKRLVGFISLASSTQLKQGVNETPVWFQRAHVSLIACLLIVLFSSMQPASAQSVQEGQALFGTKCYSCHNVGSGDKQGPDLKGVTARRTKEWLNEFINTPAAMNSRGDAAAVELFRKFPATVMPDQALTQQQIDSILMMIDDLTNKNEMFVPAGAKLSRAIAPGDVDGGWRLFMGRATLQNGGAACDVAAGATQSEACNKQSCAAVGAHPLTAVVCLAACADALAQ